MGPMVIISVYYNAGGWHGDGWVEREVCASYILGLLEFGGWLVGPEREDGDGLWQG